MTKNKAYYKQEKSSVFLREFLVSLHHRYNPYPALIKSAPYSPSSVDLKLRPAFR